MNQSDSEHLTDTLKQLTERIDHNPEDAESLIERGKTAWRLGKVREAMNDYIRAAAIAPDSAAPGLLEQARNIMQFRHTDLLNP